MFGMIQIPGSTPPPPPAPQAGAQPYMYFKTCQLPVSQIIDDPNQWPHILEEGELNLTC